MSRLIVGIILGIIIGLPASVLAAPRVEDVFNGGEIDIKKVDLENGTVSCYYAVGGGVQNIPALSCIKEKK